MYEIEAYQDEIEEAPAKINWFFNWVGGGYNNVMAATREDVVAEATKITESLTVNEATIVADPDYTRTNRESARWY